VEKSSFKVTRLEEFEEFNPQLDDYTFEVETWYLFEGDYTADHPYMDIDIVLEVILTKD
jgi:hypothetical protein